MQYFLMLAQALAGGVSALPPEVDAAPLPVLPAPTLPAPMLQAPIVLPASLARALTSASQPGADAALRSRWRSAVLGGAAGTAWDAECEQDQRDSGAAAGLASQRLPDGSWLLRLDCGAGAYQGSFWAGQVWRQAGQWRGAVLAWPVAVAGAGVGDKRPPFTLRQAAVLWGALAVLPGGGVEVVNRFRGLGDCGTRSVYQVKQGTVRFVVLAAVWACPDTPASVPLGPPDWPIVTSFGR